MDNATGAVIDQDSSSAIGTILDNEVVVEFRDRDGNHLTDRAVVPYSVDVMLYQDRSDDYQWPADPLLSEPETVWTEQRSDGTYRALYSLPADRWNSPHWPGGLDKEESYTLEVSVYGVDKKLQRFNLANGTQSERTLVLTAEDVSAYYFLAAGNLRPDMWATNFFKKTGSNIRFHITPDEFTDAEEAAVWRAIRTWENTGVVGFSETSSTHDVDVVFHKHKPSDEMPNWAHAEPGGIWNVHFAGYEPSGHPLNWKTDSRLTYDSPQWEVISGDSTLCLESFALHEIGHVLGLWYTGDSIYWGGEGHFAEKTSGQQWSIVEYTGVGKTHSTLWLGWSDVMALRRIHGQSLSVTAYSPVDLVVRDASGNTVSKSITEIPGAEEYLENDLDGKGDLDDRVTIPIPFTGEYSIQLIPEPDADPGETVTLIVEDHGIRSILLDEVRVADLPSEPIVVSVDRTAPTVTVDPESTLLTPTESWIPVHVDVGVQDETDSSPQVALSAIEPSWDVDPQSVIQDADYGTADTEFQLLGAAETAGQYYTITYGASDETGNLAHATTTVGVTGLALNEGALQIIGTNEKDHVHVKRKGNQIEVKTDFTSPKKQHFDVNEVSSIYVLLGDGDDHLHIHKKVGFETFVDAGRGKDHLHTGGGSTTIDAGRGDDHVHGGNADDVLNGGPGDDHLHGKKGDDSLSGGPGDDHLHGDAGDDVLSGGDGEDKLHGGKGNDLVVGGRDSDDIKGNSGSDIVIAGYTLYDDDHSALGTLSDKWTSTAEYSGRATAVRTDTGDIVGDPFLEAGITVFDDQARDKKIDGGAARDLFFADLDGEDDDDDKIRGLLEEDELVVELAGLLW